MGIAMQYRIFGALFVIQNKLDGDAGAFRPTHIRELAPVADQIAVVGNGLDVWFLYFLPAFVSAISRSRKSIRFCIEAILPFSRPTLKKVALLAGASSVFP